jgi:hypothetical protein
MLLGAELAPDTAAHLLGCEHCRAYVDRARAERASLGSDTAPLPPWLSRVATELPAGASAVTPPRVRRGMVVRSWPRWALAAGVGVALAVGAGLWPRVQTEYRVATEEPYVAAKGAPGVGVYVMREGRVFSWNGVDAVRAGDRIRLGVAPDDYRHVVVCTRHDHGLVTLYRGELRGASDLPVAWTIDGEGDAERLLVVLSHEPRSDAELRERDRRRASSRDDWTFELVLPKQ